ncbi:MAG: threonine--tRNA ligase [bacterium]|nr:threonine--tRNA ligase [bacterium]
MPVILKNGNRIQFSINETVRNALSDLDIKDVIGVRNGNTFYDLQTPIREEGEFELVYSNSEEGLEILRHTTAHIMAQAVNRLFPNVEFAIGPVIQDGFYYDFDLEHIFSPDDFPLIEQEMQKIIQEKLIIQRIETNKQGALEILSKQRAKYKNELVETLDSEIFSFYSQGEFVDLCRGPHLPNTGLVPAFKILSVAGAYWRGDEKREMLQRLYGTAFWRKEDLDDYLKIVEEAKKRDHRNLGKELDLFSFHIEGLGFPFWHPNGTILYNAIVDFWREKHREFGYEEIKTPMILSDTLWHQSGHWEHYRENMYFTKIDDKDFAVKPMNCPGGTLVYRSSMWSYRDLPIRMAELGHVHRHEKSGVLSGLFRVRSFTQDDAHIYCTPEQLETEVSGVMKLLEEIYHGLGFTNYDIELSTRPMKSIGSDEMWEKAELALANVLNQKGVKYKVNHGEGAFYGPKIDFHIRDALRRTWQCGTIQVDFSMPERFDMEYTGKDGQKHRPVMIHRAILGSLERFIGILIEHYGGAFPTWLSPVQVVVIPISSEKHIDYAKSIYSELFKMGIRVKLDAREESLNYRIRDNQNKKVPYLFVVGGREAETNKVAIRKLGKGDLGSFSFNEIKLQLFNEIKLRKNIYTLGE